MEHRSAIARVAAIENREEIFYLVCVFNLLNHTHKTCRHENKVNSIKGAIKYMDTQMIYIYIYYCYYYNFSSTSFYILKMIQTFVFPFFSLCIRIFFNCMSFVTDD